ncbi:MAG: ArsR/SmtB family transcription factor [Dermatophilaceae bacterium]
MHVDRHRLDTASVRVLAHPLRSRLVGALRLRGPSTATDLARELGTNSGATSYHLRRLEAAGLVVDTESGDGKRRVWAAATDSTRFVPSDFDTDEDAATAMGWLEQDWLRHFTEKFGRWLDVGRAWPVRWRDEAGMNDYLVVVTAEQLAAMHAEMQDVIEHYRRAGQGSPEAKRVATYLSFYPVDMDQAPRR